jgi:hypothetical protein
MNHTHRVSTIGPALETYVNGADLGLQKVWYGDDDELIPETPAVLIVPSTKDRELTNTGHTTLNSFHFVLTVFHSRLTSSNVTRKECDALAEALEDHLHANKRLNGLLLHSHVQRSEYGVAARGTVLMKATRLTWIAQSQTRI